MQEYLYNLWNKFKNTTLFKKIILIILIIIYLLTICGCLIKIDVDLTTPGVVTNVSNVIDIESDYQTGNIYTVSIYSKNKVSLFHYLISTLDSNSEIIKGKSITYDIFTEKEEYVTNVGYKEQSIQDSIIIAYQTAIKNNYDVSLDYNYKGQQLLNIPQNLFKTGAEDFKNGDIISGFNDVLFLKEEDYYTSLDDVFSTVKYNNELSIRELKDANRFEARDKDGNKIEENINLIYDIYEQLKNNKQTFKFNVIRDKKEIEINASLKMLFYLYSNYIINSENKLYSLNTNNFTKYEINYDNCNPKININKSTSVGPSGGLLQTLAVYNSITFEDITKGLRIMGTGGIDLDGNATSIGGEQQKVITANFYGANVFFIPEENYESAKSKYDTIDPIFELVSVKTFDDVLQYLNNKEVNNE